MAISVGSVSVDVVPDATRFRREMQAKLADATVTVHARLVQAALDRQLDEATRDRTATLKAKVDDAGAKTQLDLLARPRDVKLRVNDSGGIQSTTRHVSALVVALVALGPALIPITAASVGVLAGLGTGLAAIAAGAGVALLAFKGLSSATAEGARFLAVVDTLKAKVAQLQTTARRGLLPGVTVAINEALPLFPIFNRLVDTSAKTLNGLAIEAGHALQAPFWRQFFDFLGKTAGPNLTVFARILGNVATGFAGLAQAFYPVAQQVGVGLLRLTERFSDFGQATGGSSGFQHFLDYVRTTGPQVADVLGGLIQVAVGLLQALAPFGGVILVLINATTHFLALPILDFFTSLPGPIQAATVALIAFLLLRSKFDAMGKSVSGLKTRFLEMRSSTGALKAGLSGVVGLLGGPWGIALAGASLGLGFLISQHQKAAQVALDLADAIKADNGALKENSVAAAATILQQKGLLDRARQLGISYATVTQAAIGNRDAQNELNAAIIKAQDAAAAGQVGANAQLQNLLSLADAVYGVNRVAQDQVTKYKELAAATTPWTAATGAQTTALGGLALKVDGVAVTMGTLSDALDRILGNYQTVPQAQATFEADLDNLTKKVVNATGAWNKNHTAVNLNTAAGRALQGYVISAIGDNAKLAEAVGKQTGSQAKANDAWNTGRERLLKQLQNMGLTATQAQKLIDKYGGMEDAVKRIPKDASTKFTAPGLDAALRKARALGDLLRANALQTAINYSTGNAYRTTTGATGGMVWGNAIHRDLGGMVRGAGTATSDSVPALLSNGEFVFQTAAAKAIGYGLLAKINAMGSKAYLPAGVGAYSASAWSPSSQDLGGGGRQLPGVSIETVYTVDVDGMARAITMRQQDALAAAGL